MVTLVGRAWYGEVSWMLWGAIFGVDSVDVVASRSLLCFRSFSRKQGMGVRIWILCVLCHITFHQSSFPYSEP